MIKILEGENPFLSKQRLECLVKGYLKERPDSIHKVIEADNTNISDIIREYETQDIFSQHKLLVLKRLISNKEHKEFIEKITSQKKLPENVDLIIWEEKNIPKNTRYYKICKNMNVIESFTKFNKRTFESWAKQQIAEKGLDIDIPVLKNFVEMVDYNPHLFINEIEKLKLAGEEKIDEETLQRNTNDTHINTIWELIDSINHEENLKKNTDILLNLLKNGLDPHYLMIMIARNTKQILLIKKMMEENKNDREIISTLKIPPFTLPKLKSIAVKSKQEKLIDVFEKIYNLNYESKIGNIDAELGLILLLTRLN